MRTFRKLTVVVLIGLLPCSASASWLSDITGVDINIPAGTINFGPPRPDRIPEMLKHLPKDVAVFLTNPYGSALAFEIRRARESARKNCGPVPPYVRTTLAPFFPSDLFDGVCWAVVADGFTLDNFVIRCARMGAVTLEDVIVFENAQLGWYDVDLWAHELTHVQQYRNLGVEGFAALYSAGGFDYLEQQAREFDQFVTRTRQSQAIRPQYYVVATGWETRKPISLQQYARYARESITPMQCSSFEDAWTHSDTGPPAFVNVTNNCPVPIYVTSFRFRHTQSGNLRDSACTTDCTVKPSTTKKWPVAPYEQTASVSIAWPSSDLCQNGLYKEPGNQITWTLTFTDGGMSGSRTDNACTISLKEAGQGWKGQMRCQQNTYPVTMQQQGGCQRITSDLGWLQFEK